MNDPVRKSYIVPDNCPPDIELMSIWAQAAEEYLGELTDDQVKAAISWFNAFVYSRINTLNKITHQRMKDE